jgi:hypothetical protein
MALHSHEKLQTKSGYRLVDVEPEAADQRPRSRSQAVMRVARATL